MKGLLLLLLCAPTLLLAESRFNGTWEMKMDTLEFSGTPEEYLLNDRMCRCLSCVPKGMRVESADKQRGTTMTYTAEKRP
jgi:hypothetical protein